MIDCSKCLNHCCGKAPVNAPILFPHEYFYFKKYAYEDNGFFRIKRIDNLCIFLTDKNRCAIYPRRPIECRLYPYIISFTDGELTLKLHDDCSEKEHAKKPEIPIQIKNLPTSWLEKWENLLV